MEVGTLSQLYCKNIENRRWEPDDSKTMLLFKILDFHKTAEIKTE